jgi:hypothetical protein
MFFVTIGVQPLCYLVSREFLLFIAYKLQPEGPHQIFLRLEA